MEPLASGRPVHTRSLDVHVRWAGSGRWELRGTLVDLRKAGFVPVAGEIQTSGLLHQMHVRARIEPVTGVIEAIEAVQPVVAFEPSALSAGESCRDPAARIGALAGRSLDGSEGSDEAGAGPLDGAIGAERGCSHVLALARLLLATAAWLRGRGEPAASPGPAGGELLRRSLCFDGQERGDALVVALQLTDVLLAPVQGIAPPARRLAELCEVRAEAEVALADLSLRALSGARRSGGPGRAGSPPASSLEWRPLEPDGLAPLRGHSLARGMRRRLREAFPEQPAGEPLLALLLDLPAAAFQCVASRCDEWPARLAGDPRLFVSAGRPDSCWMWRRGGAFDRGRREEESAGEG